MGDPSRFKELLRDVGDRLGLPAAVETGLLWRRWPEIVGPELAAHVEPTSLRAGILRVRATSPTWATEVGYLGPQIARLANAAVGKHLVVEVRVWTGPGPIRRSARPAPVSAQKAPLRAHHDDPAIAFERARRAWAERHSRS